MAITTDAGSPQGKGGDDDDSKKSPGAPQNPDSTTMAACAGQSSREEDAEAESTEARASPSPSIESGEASEGDQDAVPPRLPNEPVPVPVPVPVERLAPPPLPSEPVPDARAQPTGQEEDDGWEYHWNPNTTSYWFYNRYSQVWQQENPRLAAGATATTSSTRTATMATLTGPSPPPDADSALSAPGSVANGYNPAIHGDYDPNAWYAQEARAAAAAAAEHAQQQTGGQAGETAAAAGVGGGAMEYASGGFFNSRTGQWQTNEQGPERHSDEAKSRRQMKAYFDVDAAANMHDGRSLKAERAGKKPSRSELKAFKEKRKAKKEEKRRAWLRD